LHRYRYRCGGNQPARSLSQLTNIFFGDITVRPKISEIGNDKFDYAVFGEVLEHIGNPVYFLKSFLSNYKENIGQVIITVPNALRGASAIWRPTPATQFLLRHAFRSGLLKLKQIRMVPGNLNLFWGYRSVHANEACDPDKIRATALFHFGDPHADRSPRRFTGRAKSRARIDSYQLEDAAPLPEATR
jgi:hypothetical protein